MAEYYGEKEDEKDEDCVKSGALEGVGGCEGEICGVLVYFRVIGRNRVGDEQVVRTMVSRVPKTRQPMIFFLILGSFLCDNCDFPSSL